MRNVFLSFRNALDYPLRQFFKWQWPMRRVKNQPKADLYRHLNAIERQQAEAVAERLRDQYHLGAFFASSKADNYRENLYYLEMIERALNSAAGTLPEIIAAADIGVSHWFYIQALNAALKWWCSEEGRTVDLLGYEMDAYRIYADFHSRYDRALAHIGGLQNAQYIPQAFEAQPGRFDLITMFFPFIFVKDHLKWGLPKAAYDPVLLLDDIWNSLAPEGILLVVNQGVEEHQRQIDLFRSLGIQPVEAFEHTSHLYQYPHPRHMLVVVK